MCGIVGAFMHDGGVRQWQPTIEHAMQLMASRGPDASGYWSDGERCAFGFRRLSILDLSAAGSQPMATADGRYVLVYNGEVYNFREIRRSLQNRGVSFKSTGDTEVVLHALAVLGDEALASFNGMFALAFYDTRTRRLLLARDHAGIKPLYVLSDRDGVFFASQYDQILSHPWARTQAINPGSLALYLNLGYIPPPYALLERTRALEAGAWMSVDANGERREGRHFTFPRNPVPDLFGAEAHEAVDAAIAAAVRRQLVSDVPVGVWLSGGIDSPLVAAKMRQATNASFPAFTLATGDARLDEAPDARRYAEALDLEHIVQPIASGDVVGVLDDVVAAYSEPHDDYSAFPTAVISRVARERVTVVLSGDGGDDVFWGYPDRMIGPLRPPSSAAASGWRDGVRRAIGLDAPPAASTRSEDTGREQLRRQRFVNANDLAAIFPSLPPLPPDFALFDCDGAGGVNAVAQWLRWNEYTGHLGRVLQKVDRMSMHHSLEVRVPLLDRDVIDVATRVDWRSCVDVEREIGKLPLRASLERHVGFQTQGKRGFSPPMAAWLRGPLRPLFEDTILTRRELLGLPLDQSALKGLFRQHVMRMESSPWLLWRLLSLALWEARHFRPVPAHA